MHTGLSLNSVLSSVKNELGSGADVAITGLDLSIATAERKQKRNHVISSSSSAQSQLGAFKPRSFLEFLVDTPICRENHCLKDKGVVILELFCGVNLQLLEHSPEPHSK